MRSWLGFAEAVTVLLLAVLACPAPSLAGQNPKPEDELAGLVREWLDAEARNDHAALDHMIAEDFMGTAFGGAMVTKNDIVPPEGGEDGPRFPKTKVEEWHAHAFGTTGIVMGRATSEGSKPSFFRFTVVYQKRQQGWQMIAAHLVHVEPQP